MLLPFTTALFFTPLLGPYQETGKPRHVNGVNLSDQDVFFGSSLRFILDVDPGKGGFHILYMI